MPANLAAIGTPWGPPMVRAINVDITTRNYVNSLGFFAIPVNSGTLTVRLAAAKAGDPSFTVTAEAGKIIRLGDIEVPLSQVNADATVATIIVGWPAE